MVLVFNSELYHHGVLGQKWGKRNGPPYPLSSSVSTGDRLIKEEGASRKKSSGGIGGYIRKKKLAKKRMKSLEKARKARAAKAAEKKRQEEFAKNKEKILSTDADTNKAAREILKNVKDLNADEIQKAVQRLSNIENLKKYVKEEPTTFEKFKKKIDKAAETATWAADRINDGVKLYNAINSMITKFDSSQSGQPQNNNNNNNDNKKKDKNKN